MVLPKLQKNKEVPSGKITFKTISKSGKKTEMSDDFFAANTGSIGATSFALTKAGQAMSTKVNKVYKW